MRRVTGGDAADIERVLRFWLGELGPVAWYRADAVVDRRCAEDFGSLIANARAARISRWCTDPPGVLATLILLDQMPRNAFRGTSEAFAADRRACAVAKLAISLGHDLEVAEPERQFFYLPLMHSESLADQDRCVRLILLRLPESGAENLRHAIQHRDVIRRFGRFPSRNKALGRTDTDDERAYRAAGGYMS